jgi:hypothetical protein
MIIQLPAEKAKLWDADLKRIIKLGDKESKVGAKCLKRIQGRNVNMARMVPGAMHFHSRMYQAIARAKKHKTTRLTVEERLDLRLLRHMLAMARWGINLNDLVCQMPDHLGYSNAFKGGIGGFNISSG